MDSKVEGIPQLMAKFRAFSDKGNRLMKAIIQATGDQIAAEAKNLAPADLGTIRQNIVNESSDDGFKAVITSNAPESPYQEFGTGARVNVPAEMIAIAMQFKGGGNSGTFDEFVKSLTEWVKRKGITSAYSIKTRKRSTVSNSTSDAAAQMAYVIAVAILRRGLTPKPFMYPAWLKYAPKLSDKLKAGLKRLANEES